MQLYLPLVEAFATRYGRRGAEVEDLVQVGSIGLLKAIERYDPRKGEEFTAFAVPTIAGEIKRHLRDRTTGVGLPRRLREAGMRLPRAREGLTSQLGRAPETHELAAELGVDEKDIAVLEQGGRSREPDAVEEPGSEGDVDLDDRILLAGAFQALDETERSIVYLRFIRELSRRETAKRLGMTEDALRGRTQAALAKLRGELEQSAFPAAAREAPEAAQPATKPRAEPKPTAEREPSQTPNGKSHSGRLLVRMPQSLHDELAQAAERDRVSLNQFITNALASTVGWQQAERPPQAERQGQTPRWLPAAIVTNIVVLSVAGIAALILILVAWQQGW